MNSIASFLAEFCDGATEADILREYPGVSKNDLAKTLNSLIREQKIDVINDGGVLRYRVSQAFKSYEEKIIYNLVKESGSTGMWLRDIKTRSNMAQALAAKILKEMEHKLLIKAVKSVKSNKKVYILHNLMPSEELTGGIWFNEGEVDEEFVHEVTKVVYAYLARETSPDSTRLQNIDTLPTIADVHRFITQSKISSVRLAPEDIRALLDVMVADGAVHEVLHNSGVHYRALRKTKSE